MYGNIALWDNIERIRSKFITQVLIKILHTKTFSFGKQNDKTHSFFSPLGGVKSPTQTAKRNVKRFQSRLHAADLFYFILY